MCTHVVLNSYALDENSFGASIHVDIQMRTYISTMSIFVSVRVPRVIYSIWWLYVAPLLYGYKNMKLLLLATIRFGIRGLL